MEKAIIFIPISMASFIILSYFNGIFLGALIALIILCWPIIFLLVSNLIENRTFEHKEIHVEENANIEYESMPEMKENLPKKDGNLDKTKEDLLKLRMSLETLSEERNEGIIDENTFIELKKQSEEEMERLEELVAKSSGEYRGRKVYCRKGKHYISIDDCLPSKIDGYVICQEHNEEIRVE